MIENIFKLIKLVNVIDKLLVLLGMKIKRPVVIGFIIIVLGGNCLIH